MAAIAKIIVATGVSSGLGFEVIKQLLETGQSYKIILGARNTQRTQEAYDALKFDRTANPITIIPCELNDLRTVESFASSVLQKLGQEKVDYLLLSAGISKGAEEKGPHGSKWCESLVVNHYSQHYLTHLLRQKLETSQSRVVVVSSGAIRSVSDPSTLDEAMLGGSGSPSKVIYGASKFIQLLGAHWWRRQLADKCRVVAVSPGMIPATGIMRGGSMKIPIDHPDAKSVSEGAKSILAAFTRNDFPEDPEQIFLTSWGEWWEKDVYKLSLDEKLQDKWCPGKEQLEKEENVA